MLLYALVGTIKGYAQQLDQEHLNEQDFDALIQLYDTHVSDTFYARKIARTYIEKARDIRDSTKMARGYQRLAFLAESHRALKYLDTTILLSQNSTHRNFPASGYLFKSYYHYENEEYEKSLNNAIIGYQQAKRKGNFEQQLTALHQINGVNELWGDYEQALRTGLLTYDLLFKNKNIQNFSDYYLASVEGIGKSYVRLNKPDSALAFFKKGIDEALRQKDSITYFAFVSQAGTAHYVKGNYKEAMDSLQKAHQVRDQFNNSYLPGYFFYVGSILFNQGKHEEAVGYFRRIDSIYEKRHVLYPELPRVYDKLVNYYKEKGNSELQLKYLYKLVLALRLIDDKRVFIKEKTNNEYAIPALVEEKEQQIATLEAQNKISRNSLLWAFVFLAIVLAILIYFIGRQRRYKRRFENMIASRDTLEEENRTPVPLKDTGISEEIVEEILQHLEVFEQKEHFLSQDVTLNELAKNLETNSTYLSKVINSTKGKNFSQYINDLRIRYATESLKRNPTFRKYTIKAIANESGFKSAESFSKSFYKKHGIYPSYYLKQLQK